MHHFSIPDTMKRGRFGQLVGVIHVAEKKTRFLIYAASNAEILTIHEVPNEPISPQCGWLEYDPVALFCNVLQCIEAALNNLILLDIDPKDVVGLAVTNQRETCLLWDRATGQLLSNAISWNDTRTTALVRRTLKRVKNQSSYLQEVCGLPLSTCFSAFKVKWLCESSKEILEAVSAGSCYFGTLDSWIIWNLTGGIAAGTHVTDVTNASRTMYFNLETCAWDKKLCEFFKVNMSILPKIKSCSEVLGYVHDGPLRGIGIYGCVSEQQGALLGQLCFRREQVALHFNADVHLLLNTGREIVHSDHNMLSTVAFQLGPKEPIFYALEGILPGSGSSVEWLNRLTSGSDHTQNPLQLLTLLNSSQHSESIYCSPTSPASTLCGTPPQMPSSAADGYTLNTSTTAAQQFKTAPLCANGQALSLRSGNNNNRRGDIFLVPARDKVLLPGCGDPFASRGPMNGGGGGGGATSVASRAADPTRGLIYGVTKDTTSSDLIQAAYEGICFQVKQMLRALQKDCKSWHPLRKVTVGGELIEANAVNLAQTLADFCDVIVEYPQAESISSLGAMIAAGLALNVFTLDSIRESMAPPTTTYQRSLRLTETEGKYRRWEALQLAIWEVSDGEHSDNEEEEDDDDADDGEEIDGHEKGPGELQRAGRLTDEVGRVRRKRVSNMMGSVSGAMCVGKEERYKDPLYNVHRSIPGTMFATIAFATLLVADWWLKVSPTG